MLKAFKDPTVAFDKDCLSNPETFIDLPFPSTTFRPPARFTTFRDKTGITLFTFMGREIFRELYDAVDNFITNPHFGGNNRSIIHFNGLAGAGKSHILAALASLLLRQKKMVLYIPSCEILVRDPIWHFKEFASLAFPDSQEEISMFENKDHILDFFKGLENGMVVCIADRLDVLKDKPQDSNALREKKAVASEIIERISETHLLVFNESPNPTQYPVPGNVDSEEDTSSITISIYDGLTEVC